MSFHFLQVRAFFLLYPGLCRISLFFLTSFTLLSIPFIAPAATYYVDATDGADNNSGLSTAGAWKTIAKVNASKFAPGDQILFRRNRAWATSLIPSSSGIPGSPISFGAYGIGNPPVIGAGNPLSIDIYNKNYIIIENLDLRATDRCVNVISDSAATKYGITIRNNKMVSLAHGVYINATSGTYDTVTITDNDITPGRTALWQVGINFVGGVSNFTISGNTIGPAGEDGIMIYKSRNGIISGNTGGGNAENTIDVKNSHDIVISSNECSDDGEANIVVHEVDNNHIDATYNITVEKNRCLAGGQGDRWNQGYRIYSGIFIYYAKNSVVRYNWVERAFGSGIFMSDMEAKTNNNQIYGNIVLNCGTGAGAKPQGGIEIGNCVGTKVYNNTIYNQQGSGGHGIYIAGGPKATDIEVTKNIIHTAGGDLIRVLSSARKNYVSDYNCFYPDGAKFYWDRDRSTSFVDWRKQSGVDTNSLTADPQFTDVSTGRFSLKKGSPCKGKGASGISP